MRQFSLRVDGRLMLTLGSACLIVMLSQTGCKPRKVGSATLADGAGPCDQEELNEVDRAKFDEIIEKVKNGSKLEQADIDFLKTTGNRDMLLRVFLAAEAAGNDEVAATAKSQLESLSLDRGKAVDAAYAVLKSDPDSMKSTAQTLADSEDAYDASANGGKLDEAQGAFLKEEAKILGDAVKSVPEGAGGNPALVDALNSSDATLRDAAARVAFAEGDVAMVEAAHGGNLDTAVQTYDNARQALGNTEAGNAEVSKSLMREGFNVLANTGDAAAMQKISQKAQEVSNLPANEFAAQSVVAIKEAIDRLPNMDIADPRRVNLASVLDSAEAAVKVTTADGRESTLAAETMQGQRLADLVKVDPSTATDNPNAMTVDKVRDAVKTFSEAQKERIKEIKCEEIKRVEAARPAVAP